MHDIDLTVCIQFLHSLELWLLTQDWTPFAEVVRFGLQIWESSLKIRALRKQISKMDKPVTTDTKPTSPPRYRGRKRDSRLRRRASRTRL
ncbi:hypothetical protein D1872_202240 [compost metagenome]|jgi:hypothetical protein